MFFYNYLARACTTILLLLRVYTEFISGHFSSFCNSILQDLILNPSPEGEGGQTIEYFSTIELTNHQKNACSSGSVHGSLSIGGGQGEAECSFFWAVRCSLSSSAGEGQGEAPTPHKHSPPTPHPK